MREIEDGKGVRGDEGKQEKTGEISITYTEGHGFDF